MRLTLLVMAFNVEKKLARILSDVQDVADELVVGIDDTTTDATAEVARQFTENVHPIPHAGFFGRGRPEDLNAVECMLPYCHGDWLLRIDHDETLSSHWHDRNYVNGLLDDRWATQYWIPRRMVVPPGDRFICGGVWYPDYQIRLYRNIPSLVEFNRKPHERPRIAGERRYLADSWILHWKNDYPIYDEQTIRTRSLDYIYPSPSAPANGPNHGPFCASLEVLDYPNQVRANSQEPVLVSITNRSGELIWPTSDFIRPANILLSWHWFTAGEPRKIYHWDGERLDLPRRLAPGETASRFMTVTVPHVPGEYLLQPDLVQEDVAWFSAFSQIPTYPVRVVA